jgi:YesN/AraC family two-component response regulator
MATQPDVALVDIEMPGQNGLDARMLCANVCHPAGS